MESDFDGKLYKNKIWVGTVEGEETFDFFLWLCLLVFSNQNLSLCLQVCLYISLSLNIRANSSGEDSFTESKMISNASRTLAALR